MHPNRFFTIDAKNAIVEALSTLGSARIRASHYPSKFDALII